MKSCTKPVRLGMADECNAANVCCNVGCMCAACMLHVCCMYAGWMSHACYMCIVCMLHVRCIMLHVCCMHVAFMLCFTCVLHALKARMLHVYHYKLFVRRMWAAWMLHGCIREVWKSYVHCTSHACRMYVACMPHALSEVSTPSQVSPMAILASCGFTSRWHCRPTPGIMLRKQFVACRRDCNAEAAQDRRIKGQARHPPLRSRARHRIATC